MTVGMAAVAEVDSDNPKIVLSSDRLVTTRQLSAIEHEHPETKLKILGENLNNTHIVGVIAGSVQLGETFEEYLNSSLLKFVEDNDEEPYISTAADLAGNLYRTIVQEKIENVVLSTYGIDIDDLSKQHQFKDEFLNNILSESKQVEQSIQQNLTLLLGGVGQNGPGVYEVSNNDVSPRNEMGYGTIGSGSQPAESEFIKSDGRV